MTIDKWSIGGSAREPAREPERAGSARLGILASREKRLGSFQAREPLRAEPSRSEPEPAREPGELFFPALVPASFLFPCTFQYLWHVFLFFSCFLELFILY